MAIVSYHDEVNPDGSFAYGYETGDGTNVQVNGTAEQQSGSVKYTSPDGSPVEWSYVADVNGFQPQGANVPQIPEPIARALAYIRDHSTTTDATPTTPKKWTSKDTRSENLFLWN